MGSVIDAERGQQIASAPLCFLQRHSTSVNRCQADVRHHGQMLEETVELKDDADLLPKRTEHGVRGRSVAGHQHDIVNRDFPGLKRLEACDGKVDLLLVDLRMPLRNGLDVVTEAHRRWPSLPAIVASGAAPEGVAQSAMAAGARAVLQKPFKLHELRALVRSVLAGAHW